MRIPIENIYYLLCYAWNKLEEKEKVAVSTDDRTELLDLFANILIKGTRILLKRGIDKSYVESTSELSGIKGKLEVAQTLKANLLARQRTICSFDEFSSNILTNQILVSTIYRLARVKGLEDQLKANLINLLPMLEGIEQIELTSLVFKKVKLNRNNRFYGFILNVCQIVYENLLPSEQKGVFTFSDFTRDDTKMNQLFEAFVRNFYKIEQTKYNIVKKEIIKWQFSSSTDFDYLPQMETDITLENDNEKIIIDAKFYRETMIVNYDRQRIRSGNLYQLFSYLLNQEDPSSTKTMNAKGILLYPTIENDYDLEFQYQSHQIEIKTVNLNTNWRSISERLKEIINLK